MGCVYRRMPFGCVRGIITYACADTYADTYADTAERTLGYRGQGPDVRGCVYQSRSHMRFGKTERARDGRAAGRGNGGGWLPVPDVHKAGWPRRRAMDQWSSESG